MDQILTAEGDLLADPPFDLETAGELYGRLVAARTFDRKGTALQKQGRLATYAPYLGQEAAQVGSAAAVEPTDWMVATYRDAAAMWMHGYGWYHLLLGRTGDERGGSPDETCRALPPSITVGAHMLHAVGLAWASRLRGADEIAITYFGDGATSEGDFHEAMNLAAVYSTGTVFVCQNNGYAISLPRHRQTRSESIAIKADAYGMPGVQVDGNDLLATYAATREAVARARGGDGPTLIEALTYRRGPHTTADDPSRYRDRAEELEWEARDPLERVRIWLEREQVWTPDWQAELERSADAEIEEAVSRAEQLPPLEEGEIVDAVFAELTPALAAQRAEIRRRARA